MGCKEVGGGGPKRPLGDVRAAPTSHVWLESNIQASGELSTTTVPRQLQLVCEVLGGCGKGHKASEACLPTTAPLLSLHALCDRELTTSKSPPLPPRPRQALGDSFLIALCHSGSSCLFFGVQTSLKGSERLEVGSPWAFYPPNPTV